MPEKISHSSSDVEDVNDQFLRFLLLKAVFCDVICVLKKVSTGYVMENIKRLISAYCYHAF